jgi:hypothetical protein
MVPATFIARAVLCNTCDFYLDTWYGMHPQTVTRLQRDHEGLACVHGFVTPHGIGKAESEVSQESSEVGREAHLGERHSNAMSPAQFRDGI